VAAYEDGVRGSAKRLVREGRIDEVRRLADAGDTHAARHLAGWLARTDRVDELLTRMADGDRSARWAYSDWLVRRRRMPEAVEVLRPLAESGIAGAQRRLAGLLAGLGRVPEAMAQLGCAPYRGWPDNIRVEAWLRSRDLCRPEYVEELRGRAASGDTAARQQLSWTVLLWWYTRTEDAVALLGDIGPSEWLHDRLVFALRHRRAAVRSTAIDLLDTPAGVGYRRTRAALLLQQGRREEAVALWRSLAAAGDRRAAADLEEILTAPPPLREIRIADHPDPLCPYGMAFSPNGRRLAVWGYGSSGISPPWRLAVWEVATGTRLSVRRLSNPQLEGVVFQRGGAVRELPDERYPRYPVCRLAPGGHVLAVGTYGRVRLCYARTGTTIRTFATPGNDGIAFSSDGALLATGGDDVRVWEVATGELVQTIATPATAVAFRPDGAMLATADSADDTVRLWSLGSGRKGLWGTAVGRLRGHRSREG
jgi:hypothetical protein